MRQVLIKMECLKVRKFCEHYKLVFRTEGYCDSSIKICFMMSASKKLLYGVACAGVQCFSTEFFS